MLIPLATQLADELSTKKMTKKEIEQRLQQKPIEVFGFGVAFTPYSYDTQTRLYAPYFLETGDTFQLIDIQSLYDYTQPEYKWFHRPLAQGAGFGSPYLGKTSKTVLIEYAVPFYDPNDTSTTRKPIGIVFANQSVDHLNHILSSLYLGQTGYWFLVSDTGIILAHPQRSFALEQKSLTDLAMIKNDKIFEKIAKKITKNKPIFMTYNNEVTGASSWLFGEKIKETGWTLFRVYDRSEITLSQLVSNQQFSDFERQHIMHYSFYALLAAFLLTIAIATLFSDTYIVLWTTTFIISILLALYLVFLWCVAARYPDYRYEEGVVENKKGLLNFIQKIKTNNTAVTASDSESTQKNSSLNTAPLVLANTKNDIALIPTGIFISDFKFKSEDQIDIIGYVWQKYTKEIHDHLNRGFMLPQSSGIKIKKVHETTDGNTQTIIWHIQGTLNQDLSYTRYPFDVKDIEIEIWHQDFNQRIMLIPDLDAYDLINPSSLPGISTDAYLEGWNLQGSYFGYISHRYRTDFGMYTKGAFGINQRIDRSLIPELYFNVMVKRSLIDTFTEDLLPLAVIALLLFMILITSMEQSYSILGSCASVFFGTVFSQLHFREKVPAYQLVYFECFYLVMYILILAIVAISLLYILKVNIRFIQYRNNIISQLLFWPVTFASLIIITFWYLY
jgi:hypothetical protein